MDDYLSRFKSRHAVNIELRDQYEWDARYFGDKNIKTELASARRVATSLSKAETSFKHMRAADREKLISASVAMRALAQDLAVLAKWAAEYLAFCTQEREKERIDRLGKIAQDRWKGDAEALKFEADLLHELDTSEGLAHMANWFYVNKQHLDVAPEDFSSTVETRRGNHFKSDPLAIRIAAIVEEGRSSSSHRWVNIHHEPCYKPSWHEYEAYLKWRLQIKGATANVLQNVTCGLWNVTMPKPTLEPKQ